MITVFLLSMTITGLVLTGWAVVDMIDMVTEWRRADAEREGHKREV